MKNKKIQEIRSAYGKLFAKYYPEKGIIEIIQHGHRVIIFLPLDTQIYVAC